MNVGNRGALNDFVHGEDFFHLLSAHGSVKGIIMYHNECVNFAGKNSLMCYLWAEFEHHEMLFYVLVFLFVSVAVAVSKTILLILQQLYTHFHSITDSWHILEPEHNGVYSADDKCVFFQQMASNFKSPNHVRCCRRYHHHHTIIRCQAIIWTNAGIYIIYWTLTNKILRN